MEFVVIYCTVPKSDSKNIARRIVEKKYAACVSIIDKVHSIFSWDGEFCEENEQLLMIKTQRDMFEKVKFLIEELHPYNIPEVIAIPIVEGSSDYLKWINHELTN